MLHRCSGSRVVLCQYRRGVPWRARAMATSVPSIQLDPKEKQVLDLIDEFSKYLRETRRDQSDLECRVNGGWVRDKVP